MSYKKEINEGHFLYTTDYDAPAPDGSPKNTHF